VEGRGRRLVRRYYLSISLEQLSKATKDSGYPVSGPRFKPDTSQIRSPNVPHSAAKFGRCHSCIVSHAKTTVNDDEMETI
jgi:hypothetical protein